MANKGTATDLDPTSLASEAAAAAFDIDPHLVKLMWDEPFYSNILRRVTKVRTKSIPTAGVLAKDGDIKLWWNPRFLASLTAKQVKGLLKHECLHLILEHTTTRRRDPHKVWNYATDLAINSMISVEELPEGGLIPGVAWPELTTEQLEKFSEKHIERYNRLSTLIESLEPGLSSDEYFAILLRDENAKDDIEGNGGEGGEGGEGEEGLPGTMDDHDGWGEMGDDDREFVKGKVKQILEDAVKECDKKGQWGTVSGETRKMLRELIANEIPWQSILRRFVGMTRRANRNSTIRRVNRKYPGIHPGIQKGYTSSIAVYIDQSGSVGDAELEMLFAELRSLAKQTEFVCYHFDSEVDVNSETVWRKGRTPGAHRTRCGGTCFKVVTEHANKNKSRFDGYLILTDGYASNPGPSSLKRGWVITPGGSADVASRNRRDVLVEMKESKKAA